MIEIGSKNLATDEEVHSSTNISSCQPLLDGSESEEYVDELLCEGLRDLGYCSFRPGQVRAEELKLNYLKIVA